MKKYLQFSLFFLAILSISCKKINHDRIKAITTDLISIESTVVKSHATIVDLGENKIIDHGFCWSETAAPDKNDMIISLGSTDNTGAFYAQIPGLKAGTRYYIRAFLSDENETIFGNEFFFDVPESGLNITTSTPEILSINSASVDGGIYNLGSLIAENYGHCWSVNGSPEFFDPHSSNGSLDHDLNFSSTISNLQLSVPYYIRTYVKLNDHTILYGNTVLLTIPDLVVTTDTFAITSPGEVTLQGTIHSLGFNPITNHGFCWSYTTANPNITDQYISLGVTGTTGPYFGTLPGLQSGLRYYFRAFATDSSYIKYGTVKSFIAN